MNINFRNVTSTLRLREYYYMVVRHKIIFAIVVAITFCASVVLAFSLPRIYRAETVLLVQDSDILQPLIQGLAISISSQQRLRTMKEELLSWARLTLLVEKLKLDKDIKNPLEYEKLIKGLRENADIRIRGAGVIVVSFEGPNPKEAQAIVQTLSDIICNGSFTSQKIDTNSAVDFIQDQMKEYRKKLEVSEERLRKFKEVYMTTLPLAIRTNEQITALKLELNRLMIDNTELHPRVIETRNLIKQLEDQRDNQMKQAQTEGADIDPEDFANLVTSVPRQEQHMTKLQRDYEVQARIYDQLLQRLETAKISQTLEDAEKGPKFKILEPARLPLQPAKPNKPLIALGGLFIGMALGCVLIYLIDLSNTSIRNLEEAVSILEFPVFGSISPIEPEKIILEHEFRSQISV